MPELLIPAEDDESPAYELLESEAFAEAEIEDEAPLYDMLIDADIEELAPVEEAIPALELFDGAA